jgi:transposase
MQAKNNQICLAHLLRDLNFLIEKEAHVFATDFKAQLTEVFFIKKEQIQNQQAWQSGGERAVKMENKVARFLSRGLNKGQYPQITTFQQSMRKYRNYLLPCLYDIEIPPDNDGSERAIRNIKVKQKISSQFKTGQQTFCAIRSVIDTLLKR